MPAELHAHWRARKESDMWRRKKKSKKDDSDSPTDSEDSGSEGTVFVDPIPTRTGGEERWKLSLRVVAKCLLLAEEEDEQDMEIEDSSPNPVAWSESLLDTDEEVGFFFGEF